MIVPDINLLLYAHNPHVVQYAGARAWWEVVINGEELVGLPNEVLFGFVRIATHARLGRAATTVAKASGLVETWLAQPQVRVLPAASDHFSRTVDLMTKIMSSGGITSDAVLAVYAIVHRATLHTTDTDFARFPGLDWRNPLMTT